MAFFSWFFLVIVCPLGHITINDQSLNLPFIFGSRCSTYIKAAFQLVLLISMFINVPNPHSVHRETLGALPPWECPHSWIWAPDFLSTAAQRESFSWAHTAMGQWTKPRGLGLSSWKEASAGNWQQGRACWPLQVAHTPWKAAGLLLHCQGMDSPTFLLGKPKGSSILGRLNIIIYNYYI